jgi:hypothetical protein
MIAGGESQSSFRLVAYSDVIQREHVLFDGFFLHTGPVAGKGVDDVGVPVMHFITETEIDGVLSLEVGGAILDYTTPVTTAVLPPSPPPYGPDRGLIRVWEIAGGSHFDKQLWTYTTAFAAREASSPADLAIEFDQPVFCGLPMNELGQGRATTFVLCGMQQAYPKVVFDYRRSRPPLALIVAMNVFSGAAFRHFYQSKFNPATQHIRRISTPLVLPQ